VARTVEAKKKITSLKTHFLINFHIH